MNKSHEQSFSHGPDYVHFVYSLISRLRGGANKTGPDSKDSGGRGGGVTPSEADILSIPILQHCEGGFETVQNYRFRFKSYF